MKLRDQLFTIFTDAEENNCFSIKLHLKVVIIRATAFSFILHRAGVPGDIQSLQTGFEQEKSLFS